jgi:hypothetical protein
MVWAKCSQNIFCLGHLKTAGGGWPLTPDTSKRGPKRFGKMHPLLLDTKTATFKQNVLQFFNPKSFANLPKCRAKMFPGCGNVT